MACGTILDQEIQRGAPSTSLAHFGFIAQTGLNLRVAPTIAANLSQRVLAGKKAGNIFTAAVALGRSKRALHNPFQLRRLCETGFISH